MDFQIKYRDHYLKNFCHIFKKVDIDSDGIINEEEFVNLLDVFNKIIPEECAVKFDKLLLELDPFNNKQIIFSSCIDALSKVNNIQFIINYVF